MLNLWWGEAKIKIAKIEYSIVLLSMVHIIVLIIQYL